MFIPMQPDNIVKILKGTKTTTVRRNNIPSGVYVFGGKQFNVINRGFLTIEEAGGIKAMIKSEDFNDNMPKYTHTINWFKGQGKLYVYDIIPIIKEK